MVLLWSLCAAPVAQTPEPARAPLAASPGDAQDSVPRHEQEARALTEPHEVLDRLPSLLEHARRLGDHREVALLRLAEANACRVLSRLACQRDAGRLAHEAAVRARDLPLQVRGLILQASGEIALQDYVAAEKLVREAERLVLEHPHPLLASDVYLAYSSISQALGKYDRAAEYAQRGLDALGPVPAPVIRARLLRNHARALTQENAFERAAASLDEALRLIPAGDDPKLRAELHIERSRIAHGREDAATEVEHARAALALAGQLDNVQLRGLAHEALGIAALDRGDFKAAREELQDAHDAFQRIGLRRDERRVLRRLAALQLQDPVPAHELARAVARLVDLETALEREDQVRAADNFESRLEYAQQQFQVDLLQQSVAAAEQRQRLSLLLIVLALGLMATLAVGLVLQRRYSLRMAEGRRQLRALTDNIPAAIAHIDRDERYLLANAQLARMVGRDASQVVGRTVEEVRGPIYARIKPFIDAALAGEEVRFESTDSGSGAPGHFNTVFVPDRGQDGSVLGFYSLTFDVTDLATARAELGRLARIDSLTGIANRRHFEERLEATLAHARRTGRGLAVLAMDLDHFKQVNDEHGHAVGDAVLREFVRRVTACVRRDDFFARLGGDEFVLLVEEPPAIAGEVIARKLLQAMLPPFEVEGLALNLGSSIGVAFADGGQSAAEVMERADQALYAAKSAGRGTFREAPRPAAGSGDAERRTG